MKKKNDTKQDLSRRDFVRTAAAAGIGGIGAVAWPGIGAPAIEDAQAAQAAPVPRRWDKTADVVVIGAGAAGLPAALSAIGEGATVIVIEENYDIGGHAIQSGGSTPLGGGTRLQKKYGIEDSADKFFADLVSNPEFRYSDRELIRVFCDESAPTFAFLESHGVVFRDQAPGFRPDIGAPSEKRVVGPIAWTGGIGSVSPVGGGGTLLMRPLETSARKLGVQILLEHSFTNLVRDPNGSKRILGLTATNQGKTVTIQARRGVIIASGGHTSHVNFRRMFDPRLTEEYQVVGEPYSRQSGDPEISAMQIGAALWGGMNHSLDRDRPHFLEKPRVIGTRYGYQSGNEELTKSPIFGKMRATGLLVTDYQNLIHVNQVGRRFVNELAEQAAWFDPCLSMHGSLSNGGGPIWAVFDADGAKREKWVCEPPRVDPNGWFFTGNTVAELASRIRNPYQKAPIAGQTLQEAVTRYNTFVDAGRDADFGKPAPKYKIQTPPFYAAWGTPCAHDSLSGLRINARTEVLDLQGQTIAGLYCAGESAGGFILHGLGRCMVQGRIAGREAARSASRSSARA